MTMRIKRRVLHWNLYGHFRFSMSAVGERSFGKLYPQPLLLFTWVHACVKERVLEHLHGVF